MIQLNNKIFNIRRSSNDGNTKENNAEDKCHFGNVRNEAIGNTRVYFVQ